MKYQLKILKNQETILKQLKSIQGSAQGGKLSLSAETKQQQPNDTNHYLAKIRLATDVDTILNSHYFSNVFAKTTRN